MTAREIVIKEVQGIPEGVCREVLDFIRFLKSKERLKKIIETAELSEATLAEDWLKPEEDEAWKNL